MNSWKASLINLAFIASFQIQAEARIAAPLAFVPNMSPRQRQVHTQTALYDPLCPTCEPKIDNEVHVDLEKQPSILSEAIHRPTRHDSEQGETSLFAPSIEQVNISLLPSDTGEEVHSFPLVITPKHDSSIEFIQAFLTENRSWLDRQLTHYGAILIRGFDIDGAAEVQSTIQSFQPKLNNQYRGTSPRSTQDETEFVFSAAEVPSYYPIAQHLEMSFLPSPPKQLFFSALQAPKTIGGETALADFRKVYRDIPKELRNKLASKGIRYRRTHEREGATGFTRDVASLQGWPDVFGTDSRAEVEEIAAKENFPVEWTGPNQDTFVSETWSPAFQLHPKTRDPVWFHHAHVFHWTTFPAELFFAFQRTKQLKFLWHALIVSLFSIWKYGIRGNRMALDATFGDGEQISWIEASQMRHAIHKNMVFSRWRKGDILMIDNWSTSHGRQPTYDTGRKVVVAWSDPLDKKNDHHVEEWKDWQ